MLLASTALVGVVTLALYFYCSSRKRNPAENTDGSKSRVSVVQPFRETQTAGSGTMGNSQSENADQNKAPAETGQTTASAPAQQNNDPVSSQSGDGDIIKPSNSEKTYSPINAKTVRLQPRLSNDGASGDNKAVTLDHKPPVSSSKVLQQAKMFESGRTVNQHYQYDANKASVGDHKSPSSSFNKSGHKTQDSHSASKTSIKSSTFSSDSTAVSNAVLQSKSNHTATPQSQNMSRNGSVRSSLESETGNSKSLQTSSQRSMPAKSLGRQRMTSFDALVPGNELADASEGSKDKAPSVDTSIVDKTFINFITEITKNSAPSCTSSAFALLDHNAFKVMMTSMKATLSHDRLQRHRAEEWSDFLTLELEAHIDARIKAEEQLEKARETIAQLRKECDDLRAGADSTCLKTDSVVEGVPLEQENTQELPRSKAEVDIKFKDKQKPEPEVTEKVSRDIDKYVTELSNHVSACEQQVKATFTQKSQDKNSEDIKVQPVSADTQSKESTESQENNQSQSTSSVSKVSDFQVVAQSGKDTTILTSETQEETDATLTQNDNDYSIALGAIGSRSSVKSRNSSVVSDISVTESDVQNENKQDEVPEVEPQIEPVITQQTETQILQQGSQHISDASPIVSQASVEDENKLSHDQCSENVVESAGRPENNALSNTTEGSDNETDSNHNKLAPVKDGLENEPLCTIANDVTDTDDFVHGDNVITMKLDGVTIDESDVTGDDVTGNDDVKRNDDVTGADGVTEINDVSFDDKPGFSFDDILKANLDYLSSDDDLDVELNQSKGSDSAFAADEPIVSHKSPLNRIKSSETAKSPRGNTSLAKSHSDVSDLSRFAPKNKLSPRSQDDSMTKSHSDINVHDTAKFWDKKLTRVERDKTSDRSAELDDTALENIQKTKLKWEEFAHTTDSGKNSASASGRESRRRSLEGEDDLDASAEISPGKLLATKQLWEMSTQLETPSPTPPSAPSQRRMSMEGGAEAPDVQQVRGKWETLFEDKPEVNKQEVNKRRNIRLVSKTEAELEADIMSLDVNADSIGSVSNTKNKWEHLLRDEETRGSKKRSNSAKRATRSKAADFGSLRGKFELRPTNGDEATEC